VPYIKQEKRIAVKLLIRALITEGLEAGDLNYVISRLLYQWCEGKESYATYNTVIGILECAKQEFYHRVVAPYEQTKRQVNGDVYC